ncbi:MAG: helix-hairpin-helix domain-containing protein [Planctomycetota bacterium]
MTDTPQAPQTFALRGVVWWGLVITLVGVASGRFVAAPATNRDAGPLDSGYRIDVNRGDADTLQLLPGIGPSIAENVVAWRTEHGPFATPAELENVRMIGPVLRERITPWITFGPSPGPARPENAQSRSGG